jgi:hypothetical protein
LKCCAVCHVAWYCGEACQAGPSTRRSALQSRTRCSVMFVTLVLCASLSQSR